MTNSLKALNEYIMKNNGRIKGRFCDINDLKQIGQGGNAMVFSGKIANNNVAVKFLINSESKKIKRFIAEYINIALKRDNLKNTINYIDFDYLIIDDKTNIPYIIMPLFQESLIEYRKEQVKNTNVIDFEIILTLLKDLLDSLRSLENEGIIHRDIKPENILVKNNHFYISDFGIAHFNEDYPINNLTAQSDKLANFQFAAPEQIDRKNVSFATDIYSAMLVIYWMVFGETCKGTTRYLLPKLYKHEKAELIDNLIAKGLDTFPERRFNSVDEIQEFISKKKKMKEEEKNKKRNELNFIKQMDEFSDAVISVVPECFEKIYKITNSSYIDDIFNNINNLLSNCNIWFNTGWSNNSIKQLKKIENGNFLINNNEINISKMWLSFHNSNYKDILLLELGEVKPYTIKGKDYSKIAILNDKNYVPLEDIDSGWVRLNGKVKRVSDLKVEIREIWSPILRNRICERYMLIGTEKHCSIISPNNQVLRYLQTKNIITKNILEDFVCQISKRKDSFIEKLL